MATYIFARHHQYNTDVLRNEKLWVGNNNASAINQKRRGDQQPHTTSNQRDAIKCQRLQDNARSEKTQQLISDAVASILNWPAIYNNANVQVSCTKVKKHRLRINCSYQMQVLYRMHFSINQAMVLCIDFADQESDGDEPDIMMQAYIPGDGYICWRRSVKAI